MEKIWRGEHQFCYSNEDRTAGIIVKANRLHSTRSIIVFYCAKWVFVFPSIFFQVQRPDVLAVSVR